MTSQQRYDGRLNALARLCSFTVDQVTLEIYDAALAPLGYDRVVLAIDKLIVERRARDPFPSVKDIVSVLMPETNPEAEAIEAASRMAGAIQKFGWDTVGTERARAYIGELGWKVIGLEGGWEKFVQSIKSVEDLPTLKAQWRNACKAMHTRSAAGLANEAPGLPEPTRTKDGGLIPFQDVLRIAMQKGGAQ